MMTQSSGLWQSKHVTKMGLSITLLNKVIHLKKIFCTPSSRHASIFSLLDDAQTDSLWRMVNRNVKLCTLGVSTFLLSSQDNCLLFYSLLWTVHAHGMISRTKDEECRPDCSSKQVLHAFEDAHWLQTNWIWKSGCTCTHFTTHNQLRTKMSMILMSQDCCHVPVTSIRESQENDEREQIACTSRWLLWNHYLAQILDPLYIVCVYSWYSVNNK